MNIEKQIKDYIAEQNKALGSLVKDFVEGNAEKVKVKPESRHLWAHYKEGVLQKVESCKDNLHEAYLQAENERMESGMLYVKKTEILINESTGQPVAGFELNF